MGGCCEFLAQSPTACCLGGDRGVAKLEFALAHQREHIGGLVVGVAPTAPGGAYTGSLSRRTPPYFLLVGSLPLWVQVRNESLHP